MTTTSSGKTAEVVCNMFATYGLLEELISENNPQFISEDFQTFLWQNSVKHARSVTCHPA